MGESFSDRKEEQDRAERLSPLVAAYLAARQEPCSLPEMEEAFQALGFHTFHMRDALRQLVDEGKATFTPRWLVQAKPDIEIPPVVRLALETVLVQCAIASLVAAGEKLLLCKKYSPVTEIVDLLETLGDTSASQKLRESMIQTGAISPEEVWPY